MLREKISIRIKLIAHLSVLGSNPQHEAENSFLKLKIVKKKNKNNEDICSILIEAVEGTCNKFSTQYPAEQVDV